MSVFSPASSSPAIPSAGTFTGVCLNSSLNVVGVSNYGALHATSTSSNLQSSNYYNVFSVVAFDTSTNAVALSSNNNGIWYSSDSGVTWIQSNVTTDSFSCLSINGTNAIAGSSSLSIGLWYSVNTGSGFTTWIQSNRTTIKFNSVAIVGTTAIAGAATGNGLWYSTNTGSGFNSWLQSVTTNSYVVTMVGTNAVACSINGVGALHSSNSGNSWLASSNTASTFESVAMNTTNVVAGSSAGIWYSVDSGVNWIQSNINTGTIYSVYMTSSTAIAGSSNDTLYHAALSNLFSWTASDLTTAICYSLNMSGTTAIAGSNVGMWQSSNSGVNWLAMDTIANYFKSVDMVGANAIACTTTGTGLWYSSNSGQTWTRSVNFTTDKFNRVNMIGTYAIAVSSSQSNVGIVYSSDSGVTWTNTNITTVNFISTSIVGTRAIVSSSNAGIGLYYSTNIGSGFTTWTISDAPATPFVVNMFGTNAVAGSNSNSGLWYSADSGQTWTQSTTNTGYFGTGINITGTNAIAGGSSSTLGIWYSTNSGQTWTQSNITTVNIYTVFIIGTHAIAGSYSNTGLYYSTDTGSGFSTWFPSNVITQNYNTVYMFGSLALAGSNTYGGLLTSDDFGQTWSPTNITNSGYILNVFINTSNQNIAVGNGITLYNLSAVCFTKYVSLLNNKGKYVSIMDIKRGDMVKTLKDGYVKVKYINKKQLLNDTNKPLNSIWKYKDTNYIVTGGHSMLVNSLSTEQYEKQLNTYKFTHKVDNKPLLLACVSDDFKQIQKKEIYDIYHVVLEHNGDIDKQYGIYVCDGILTETISERLYLQYYDTKPMHNPVDDIVNEGIAYYNGTKVKAHWCMLKDGTVLTHPLVPIPLLPMVQKKKKMMRIEFM